MKKINMVLFHQIRSWLFICT